MDDIIYAGQRLPSMQVRTEDMAPCNLQHHDHAKFVRPMEFCYTNQSANSKLCITSEELQSMYIAKIRVKNLKQKRITRRPKLMYIIRTDENQIYKRTLARISRSFHQTSAHNSDDTSKRYLFGHNFPQCIHLKTKCSFNMRV
jgi:hypothetical protein